MIIRIPRRGKTLLTVGEPRRRRGVTYGFDSIGLLRGEQALYLRRKHLLPAQGHEVCLCRRLRATRLPTVNKVLPLAGRIDLLAQTSTFVPREQGTDVDVRAGKMVVIAGLTRNPPKARGF